MLRANRLPANPLHMARNCAVVTLHGKNHYLGAFGSAESREKYATLMARWIRHGHEVKSE